MDTFKSTSNGLLKFRKNPRPSLKAEVFSSIFSSVNQKLKNLNTLKKFKSNILSDCKSKASRISGQSPILKAYKDIDKFYESIKPERVKQRRLSIPVSNFRQVPELLVSFHSDNFSEFDEIEVNQGLSNICSLKNINHLENALNIETLNDENEE